MGEAHNSFRTSFLLHSLNPVFLEIYRAHSTASFIVYRFSSEAQDFFNDIEDRVRIGVAEIAEAIIVESGDEDDSDDEREPIKSPIGTKFIDQLGWLSLFTPIFICFGTDPWAHGRADFHSSGNFFGHHNKRQTTS